MYKNEDRKLTDLILGEAVMTILDDDAPVSFVALLNELESILMTENDAERKKATLYAINMVKAHIVETSPLQADKKQSGKAAIFFAEYIPAQ